MGLFPHKVAASSRPVGLAILSIHSALSIGTLRPIIQKSEFSSAAPPKLRRKALLIGVNGGFAAATEPEDEGSDFEEEESHSQAAGSPKARGTSTLPLKGPREDVKGLKQLLIRHYKFEEEDITLLMDDGVDGHVQPTKDNIILAIEKFVSGAQPFDQFVFAFAGHGFQKKAKPEDKEEDGFNEYIVASCGRGIKDNVLKEKLVDPLHPTCKLTAIFDSCHSATLLDLEHSKCNRVYMPWINKGKRRSRTLQYQTTRRYGLMPDRRRRSRTSGSAFGSVLIHAHHLKGRRTHSRPPLRAQTLEDNIHLNGPSKPHHTHTPALSQDYITETVITSAPQLSQPFPRRPQRKPKLLTIDVRRNSTNPSNSDDQMQPIRFLDNTDDIVESPTAMKCTSPPPEYSCDGETCSSRQDQDGHCQMADVICLSSSQDGEPTWEDYKGRSMISHLIKILKKNRNPTLHDLMKEIGHRIHQSNRRLHEGALKFKREMRAREAMAKNDNPEADALESRMHSDLEITHFQRPELSSRVPLNMNEKRWAL